MCFRSWIRAPYFPVIFDAILRCLCLTILVKGCLPIEIWVDCSIPKIAHWSSGTTVFQPYLVRPRFPQISWLSQNCSSGKFANNDILKIKTHCPVDFTLNQSIDVIVHVSFRIKIFYLAAHLWNRKWLRTITHGYVGCLKIRYPARWPSMMCTRYSFQGNPYYGYIVSKTTINHQYFGGLCPCEVNLGMADPIANTTPVEVMVATSTGSRPFCPGDTGQLWAGSPKRNPMP